MLEPKAEPRAKDKKKKPGAETKAPFRKGAERIKEIKRSMGKTSRRVTKVSPN